MQFNVCIVGRVGDYGFGLKQVIFCLIKALFLVYEYFRQRDMRLEAVINRE